MIITQRRWDNVEQAVKLALRIAARGDVDGLVNAIGEAWALKPDGRTWKGCTEDTAADVSMRAIGG